jgi:hypothetical protein
MLLLVPGWSVVLNTAISNLQWTGFISQLTAIYNLGPVYRTYLVHLDRFQTHIKGIDLTFTRFILSPVKPLSHDFQPKPKVSFFLFRASTFCLQSINFLYLLLLKCHLWNSVLLSWAVTADYHCRWPRTAKMCLLTVLEAKSLRSKCGLRWLLTEALREDLTCFLPPSGSGWCPWHSMGYSCYSSFLLSCGLFLCLHMFVPMNLRTPISRFSVPLNPVISHPN